MESLYRKYRPLTFDSVVGQQHIVSTLEHAITEGRLSHAYLFPTVLVRSASSLPRATTRMSTSSMPQAVPA